MARSCIVGGQGKAADVRTEVFGIAEREPCFRASLASDFEFNPIGRENENERRKTWLQQQQRKIWHFVIGFMDRYRIALWRMPADFDGWQMGTDSDGNGCGPELVSGRDTLPW